MKYLPLLKEATQCQHRQLETLPALRQLLAPDFSLDEYRSLLQCQYGLYACLEGRMAPFLGQLAPETFHWQKFCASSRLARDLEYLGDQPVAPVSLLSSPQINSLPQASGCCYVLLGAGFGARYIAPRLAESLGPDAPMSFYRDGQLHLKCLWRQLEDLLGACSLQEGALEQAITTARHTFAMFHQAFQSLSRFEHREVERQ